MPASAELGESARPGTGPKVFAGRAWPNWTPHRSPAPRRSVTDSTLTVKMLGMFLVKRGWLRVHPVGSAKTATPSVF